MTPQFQIRQDRPQMILTITPDGTIMRQNKPLDELSREELIAVVRELVAMICKGKLQPR